MSITFIKNINTKSALPMYLVLNYDGVDYSKGSDRVVIYDTEKFMNSVANKTEEENLIMLGRSQHFLNLVSSGAYEAIMELNPLYSTPKTDLIIGATDDDVLSGNNNDNFLYGDRGNDTLNGGGGDDTYFFNRGDGQDTITDDSGANRILFGEGITINDLYARIISQALVVALKEDGKTFEECSDKISIRHTYAPNYRMDAFVFADGTTLDLTGMMNLVGTEGKDSLYWNETELNINMGDGDDMVRSGDFNDILEGGKGNDSLNGQGGDDTYVFNRGDGQDTITDSSGFNRIMFGEGITTDDLYARLIGNDFVIALKEADKTFEECSDKIRITSHIYEASRMGLLVFSDGTELDLTAMMNLLGTEGDEYIKWNATQLNINTGDGKDTVIAGSYNDTIRGGKGNDALNGGGGDDTYIFNRGDGHDTITDNSGFNRIVFGEGIKATDIHTQLNGWDLILAIKEDGKTFYECSDTIRIFEYSHSANNRMGLLVFADGTTIDLTDKANMLGTDGDDVIKWRGTELNVNAGDGDDVIDTGNFDDTITGGKGNDTLNGGGGDDIYIFNRGDGQDTITDNGGFNRIVFGEGITAADIYAQLDGRDFVIALKEDGKTFEEYSDKIRIINHNYNTYYCMGALVFSDGTELDLTGMMSLLGTEGDDNISWNVTQLNISTGDGDDTVNAGDFDDTIEGGRGNDTLKGGNGDDIYIFNRGDGQDNITDGKGYNRIVFGEGITAEDIYARLDGYDFVIALKEEGKTFEECSDKIRITYHNRYIYNRMGALIFSDGTELDLAGMMNLLGTEGNDNINWSVTQLSVNTGDGDDVVTAGGFDDTIAGGKGNDTLSGGDGGDTLIGGKDDDILNGGGGDDLYIFNRGDGQDVITDNNGFNRILFGEGITANNIYARQEGNDLVITLKEEGKTFEECSDRIRIINHNHLLYRIGAILFSDGTELDLTGIMTLLGTEDDDNIYWYDTPLNVNAGNGDDKVDSGNFNDTITGGKGNDTLNGGGDDIYIFNRGDGQDIITDNGGLNRIIFGEEITADDLYAKVDGNDLVLALKEEGKTFDECSDKIRIKYYDRMGALLFSDGTTLDLTKIMSLLGTEGNDIIYWSSTQLNVNAGDGDDTVSAGNFNDTITGGKGNDNLNGRGGDDTYIFNRGDGQDVITDDAGFNRILFGEGITANDIYARQEGYDLILALKEEGKTFDECSDKIRIYRHNYETNYHMGALVFSDGTELDLTEIMNLLGTEGDDNIRWDATEIAINMGDGNDTVTAGNFNDTITGGRGNDNLNGNGGDDTYIFNRGDGQDTITDYNGFNQIAFGEGITADDIYVRLDGYDLSIALKEEGKNLEECSDKIKIIYHNRYANYRMGALVFSDGTTLDLTGMMNLLGTEGNDNISWGATQLNINTGDGDDTVYAGDGNDSIEGGNGNDLLSGGDGG
jgi:Ca2+-binding RTX toxin-like protein